MIRQTSIQAYKEIVESGRHSQMQQAVYHTLYHYGPLTRTALDDMLKSVGTVNPSFHKRLSELEKMGVVWRPGKVKCPKTGKRVYLWDVTSNMPAAPVKHRPKAVLWQERAKVLKRDIVLPLIIWMRQNNLPQLADWTEQKLIEVEGSTPVY